MIRSGAQTFHVCNYNISTKAANYRNTYVVSGSYTSSDLMNGLSKSVASYTTFVIAYYKHLCSFNTGTGSMTNLASTSADTIPLSIDYVASYSGTVAGVLIILNSRRSSDTEIFINIVKLSNLETLNSIVFT